MDWIEWVDDPWNATEVIIINLSATILLRPKIVCEREKIKNIVQYTRIYTPSSCHVESIGKENVAVFFFFIICYSHQCYSHLMFGSIFVAEEDDEYLRLSVYSTNDVI